VRSGSATFTRSDSDTLFVLPHLWIEADSVRIQRNGRWLEPYQEYRITPPGNRIWVFAPLGDSDTLVVRYSYLPVALSRTYAKRSLRELTRFVEQKDSSHVLTSLSDERTASSWTSLRRSGSLVRSVQIGTNQDLSFESSLSLQVEGKVGNDVEVVAALSDQDLPIQPEGTTESIRELDKVYVTAKSKHFEATIGDYEFDLPGRRYDAYSRKLSGLMLGAKSRAASGVVSAAISRGEFNTNRFFGEESVQGPYPLSGKNGETGIVVLAGTETVWLDGVVQRRGEDNDYVIDYAAGQITFSSRKLITSDSRIVVEFEYTNEDYERQYWAARTTLQSEKLKSGGFVTYITERDDRTRPLSLSLSDADKSAISAAGDSAAYAVGSSADSLGQSLGDYVRADTVINGATVSIFVYVPPDTSGQPQGQWQVFFDDFGIGQGDYNATADLFGRTFFEYVGTGNGRYRAARRLPLPVANDLLAFRLDRAVTEGLRGRVEVAFSNRDLNTNSQRDDSDNEGMAGTAEFGYDRAELGLGALTLRNFTAGAEGRLRQKEFTDIARSDDIEFDRDWAASTVRQANELVGESNLGFSPVRFLTMRGSAGVLTREDALNSRRFSVGSSFQPTQSTILRGQHVGIVSEDSLFDQKTDWIQQNASGQTNWKVFTPRFALTRERQLRDSRFSNSGFRFEDWSFGNLFQVANDVQVDAQAGLRSDDVRNSTGDFKNSSDAKTYGGEVRWTPFDLGRGTLRWQHRNKTFASADSASISSEAGRLELLIAPPARTFEMNVIYDALKSRTEQQLQIFVPTQAGSGSYRLENGVYVPDDQGDYELVSRNTGAFEPSSTINASAQMWIRPDETRSGERTVWQRFAFETEGTIDEQTRLPFTLGLLFLDRGKLRTAETIDGRFSLRQDVHFNRLARDFSIRVRGINSASQVARYANGGQQSIRRFGSVRTRMRYSEAFRGETEASYELQRAQYEGVSIASTDVTTQAGQHDVVWNITEQWEGGVQVAGSESRDERSQTQASVREFAPRASFTRFKKGRVDAEFRWIHVTANRARLGQDLASGSNRGENYRWSFRLSLALSENFNASVNYSGRLDAGEETVHVGRVEVRAIF
jgi:hypothetical protein